ncbi:tape measure protein [Enterococcus faecalis]|uniref:tape measure protein n=1 Tax=Enterococcus faecalis TaxID=1351 RepID=UPI003D97F10B
MKQASQSSDDFQVSQRELMAISQRTGTAFSDNASLFARSAASMREYGYSSEEVLKVTEAISTGLKLSGASTAEASSVITQFSQALAQGVLRGEEFNSVNESGDRVIRALAAGMGVARKDLKAMADNGKLTADKVVPALISPSLGRCVMNMQQCLIRFHPLQPKLKTPLWPGLVVRTRQAE